MTVEPDAPRDAANGNGASGPLPPPSGLRRSASGAGTADGERGRLRIGLWACALLVALLVHAVVLGQTLAGIRPASRYCEEIEWMLAFWGALAGTGIAVARWTRWSGRLLAGLIATVAAILLKPVAVLVVLAVILNFQLAGRTIARLAQGSAPADRKPWPAAVATLAGASLWIAAIAVLARTKVHHPAVHAGALVLLPLLQWRSAGGIVRGWLASLSCDGPAPTATERAWLALLAALAVLHLFIVAKPDAGYDAMTMHLQVPLTFAMQGRFSFDVSRYAWAVMPLGGDYAFTLAFLPGGERAARLLNLAFFALACRLVLDLVRPHVSREAGHACIALLASTPLAFLETGSLFVDNLWAAFLLGTLVMVARYARDGEATALVAAAWLAAGAMQTKAIGVFWLAPVLLAAALCAVRHGGAPLRGRPALLLGAAAVAGAWPYGNAWLRTGNPVFPFFNHWFRAPGFAHDRPFTNPNYAAELTPWSPYEMIVSAGRFIEGHDGAAGLHWLLLLPLVACAFIRPRPALAWACAGLAVVYFASVHVHQAYLRYQWPTFFVLTALGALALADFERPRFARFALLAVGAPLVAVNLRLVDTGSWPHAMLCPQCAFAAAARDRYVELMQPERAVSERLARELPGARVGFLILNAPTPAGFPGYSRSAIWHDAAFYPRISEAGTADAVLEVVQRFGLTHAVVKDPPQYAWEQAIGAFAQRHAVPLWRIGDRLVVEIRPGPPAAVSARP